jgi:hypothetical protein
MVAQAKPSLAKLNSELLSSVFSEVANGKSLRSQLDKAEISYEAFYRLIDADEMLRERYARARKHQAESNQARIFDAVDAVLAGELDPNAARVAIDALKWNAARMHPGVYGDRTALTGADGVSDITIRVLPAQAAPKQVTNDLAPLELT